MHRPFGVLVLKLYLIYLTPIVTFWAYLLKVILEALCVHWITYLHCYCHEICLCLNNPVSLCLSCLVSPIFEINFQSWYTLVWYICARTKTIFDWYSHEIYFFKQQTSRVFVHLFIYFLVTVFQLNTIRQMVDTIL